MYRQGRDVGLRIGEGRELWGRNRLDGGIGAQRSIKRVTFCVRDLGLCSGSHVLEQRFAALMGVRVVVIALLSQRCWLFLPEEGNKESTP